MQARDEEEKEASSSSADIRHPHPIAETQIDCDKSRRGEACTQPEGDVRPGEHLPCTGLRPARDNHEGKRHRSEIEGARQTRVLGVLIVRRTRKLMGFDEQGFAKEETKNGEAETPCQTLKQGDK